MGGDVRPARQEGAHDRGRGAPASAPHPRGGWGMTPTTACRIRSYHGTGGVSWLWSLSGGLGWLVGLGFRGGAVARGCESAWVGYGAMLVSAAARHSLEAVVALDVWRSRGMKPISTKCFGCARLIVLMSWKIAWALELSTRAAVRGVAVGGRGRGALKALAAPDTALPGSNVSDVLLVTKQSVFMRACILPNKL